MGHFRRGADQARLVGIVFPSLILNYAGQAAIAVSGEPINGNIFYRLCPEAAAAAAGRPGYARHRDRQPIDHHRRIFDDPPGDRARLDARLK